MSAIVILIAAAIPACESKKEPADKGSAPAAATGPRPSDGPLPTLPPLELPDDPKRAAKVDLGHKLFFDKRLSVDGSRACYSCHPNEHGSGGADPIAIGAKEKRLTRHSPVMWNVAYYKNAYYWDGRSPTLEEQGKAAWAGGNMGVGKENLDAKAKEMAAIPGYAKLFEDAFPGVAPSGDVVAQALSEYERTLICKDTAYDKFAAGDKKALSEPQRRGLDLFMGKAQCMVCHVPPFFATAMATDGGVYYNIGIGVAGKEEKDVDIGRMVVTKSEADWAAFKPPTLRNITKSAPYFHDGSVATLEEAVKILATGGIANKNRTQLLADRGLKPDELGDLIAFLGALECPEKLEPVEAP